MMSFDCGSVKAGQTCASVLHRVQRDVLLFSCNLSLNEDFWV